MENISKRFYRAYVHKHCCNKKFVLWGYKNRLHWIIKKPTTVGYFDTEGDAWNEWNGLMNSPKVIIFNTIDHEIKFAISKILFDLGADINIIAAVNSWKDTLSEDSVLAFLKQPKFDEIFDQSDDSKELQKRQELKKKN